MKNLKDFKEFELKKSECILGGTSHTKHTSGKDGLGRGYTDEYEDYNCDGVWDKGEPGTLCIDD